MSFNMKTTSGGGNFEKAPPGNHPAVLVAIVDMGHQEQEYQGKRSLQHRAYFVWELVSKKQSGGKLNHLIAIDLTLSFNEKSKLRKWVQSRLGKVLPDGMDFDITTELGQPCLLSVVLNGDFPKIEAVSAVPEGLTVPPPLIKPFAWKLDLARLSDIPGWIPYLYGKSIQDHILGSDEYLKSISMSAKHSYERRHADGTPAPADNAPIPF